MGPTLQREALAFVAIALPVGLVFGLGELLHRRRLASVEATRKLAHVGAGVVVLGLPWAVGTHWTVLALSAGFVGVLGLTRRLGWLPSIHAVQRKTRGAHLYPVAVYLVFLLSDADPLLFMVPMAVMALSDTGAALAGRRYDSPRYRVVDDHRSLAGSSAFFGLTFVLVFVGLALSGEAELPAVLVISLLASVLATAVEAVSVVGLDNLLVPYAVFVVLRATLGQPPATLSHWVLGLIVVLGLLLVTQRLTRLNVTGLLALMVAGALSWGIAGAAWFVVLLVPYGALVASGSPKESDLRRVVPTFVVPLAFVLLRLHTGEVGLYLPFVTSVCTATAIQCEAFVRHRRPNLPGEGVAALVGAAAPLAAALIFRPAQGALGLEHALAAAAAAVCGALVARGLTALGLGEGWRRALGIAGGAGLVVLLGVL